MGIIDTLKTYIKKAEHYFYVNYFISNISKFIIVLMYITVVISLFTPTKEPLWLIVMAYLFSASMASCVIYGGCIITGWLYIILPILTLLIIILNHFDTLRPITSQIIRFKNIIKPYL